MSTAVVRAGAKRGWFMCSLMYPKSSPQSQIFDGVIYITKDSDVKKWLFEVACPAIGVALMQGATVETPVSCPDCKAIGRLGARHLIRDIGYRRIAFLSALIGSQREQGFEEEARKLGCPPIKLSVNRNADWVSFAERQSAIHDVLKQISPPFGIMTGDDRLAVDLIFSARQLGLGVPKDVAVVAPDDLDGLLCASPVPISSVAGTYKLVAENAIAMMARKLAGHSVDLEPVRAAPSRIYARESTAAFVHDKACIVDAILRMRREHMHDLRVADLARESGMSLRAFQMEIRQALGRTPMQELTRLRLLHAEDLLRGRDMKLKAVALDAGYQSDSALITAFRQAYGMTPGEYRRREGLCDSKRLDPTF